MHQILCLCRVEILVKHIGLFRLISIKLKEVAEKKKFTEMNENSGNKVFSYVAESDLID